MGRAVGVVLTGLLNDGASGLAAIKSCGGTAVVQHPLDAEADQMPLAAIEAAAVDEVVAAHEIAEVLTRIAVSDADVDRSCPESVALEVDIAAGKRFGTELLTRVLPYELQATTRLEFADQGIKFTVDLPADRIVEGRLSQSAVN